MKTLEFNVPVAMLIVVIIYIHFIEIKKKKCLNCHRVGKSQRHLGDLFIIFPLLYICVISERVKVTEVLLIVE